MRPGPTAMHAGRRLLGDGVKSAAAPRQGPEGRRDGAGRGGGRGMGVDKLIQHGASEYFVGLACPRKAVFKFVIAHSW